MSINVSGSVLIDIRPNCTDLHGVLSMAEQRDVWESAQNMIERYGDDALRQVGLRLQELEQNSQPEAHRYWLRIEKAVRTLLATKESGRKH